MDTVIPKPMDDPAQRRHSVQQKYLAAVLDSVGAVPVALPSFGVDGPSAEEFCSRLDGLLFTGGLSNVYPERYGQAPSAAAEPYDPHRDATTLPLLTYAMEAKVPTFCICRGFQELNVACGGTLFPLIHEVEGRMDHRRPDGEDFNIQYGPNHDIAVQSGGRLEGILNDHPLVGPLMVNSLHLQAVDRLGDGLRVEATAEDGTVEAMSLEQTPSGQAAGYVFAAQWHPEFNATRDRLSRVLFQDFARNL